MVFGFSYGERLLSSGLKPVRKRSGLSDAAFILKGAPGGVPNTSKTLGSKRRA
jgi:hypothetical protein